MPRRSTLYHVDGERGLRGGERQLLSLAAALRDQYAPVLETIKKTAQLSDDSKEPLLKAAEEFKLAHPELFTLK